MRGISAIRSARMRIGGEKGERPADHNQITWRHFGERLGVRHLDSYATGGLTIGSAAAISHRLHPLGRQVFSNLLKEPQLPWLRFSVEDLPLRRDHLAYVRINVLFQTLEELLL